MSEIQITSQQIKSLYRQAQRIYHLHTMLNNILLNKMEFSYLEITTLSAVNEKKLKSLKKQLLNLIPVE
ncbi:TPA: hypothetical protein IAD52_03970 [Candidatus Spyradomonas excrementavium]|nr:hypothetical protein [Candidatus Spyradomonas excrementavium]